VGEKPLSEQNETSRPSLVITSRLGKRVEAHGSEAIQAAMTEMRWAYAFKYWWTLPTALAALPSSVWFALRYLAGA
jgi:hypothetical protein